MRKITLSPAAHGHVGDPLQIEADRFFGHYRIVDLEPLYTELQLVDGFSEDTCRGKIGN